MVSSLGFHLFFPFGVVVDGRIMDGRERGPSPSKGSSVFHTPSVPRIARGSQSECGLKVLHVRHLFAFCRCRGNQLVTELSLMRDVSAESQRITSGTV